MLIFIFYIYLFSLASCYNLYISTTIRDNKLYALFRNGDTILNKLGVYDLKEGSISNIVDSGRTIKLPFFGPNIILEYFEMPHNHDKDKDKLWLITKQVQCENYTSKSPYTNWMGYINLNSMSVTDVSSIIKNPPFEKFPHILYTKSMITNEYGSTLYIIGGLVYDKWGNDHIYKNSFFSYNFTTNEWVDMALLSKGKLDPIINPTVTVIENRYLILMGGRVSDNSTRNRNYKSISKNQLINNSPFDFRVYDTFTNSWDNFHIDPSIFDSDISRSGIGLYDLAPKVYKNKIYLPVGYVGVIDSYKNEYISKLGILDYQSKNFTWSSLYNEDGYDFNFNVKIQDTAIFNDSMLIITGKNKITISSHLLTFNR
jgi:hypothetical protein